MKRFIPLFLVLLVSCKTVPSAPPPDSVDELISTVYKLDKEAAMIDLGVDTVADDLARLELSVPKESAGEVRKIADKVRFIATITEAHKTTAADAVGEARDVRDDASAMAGDLQEAKDRAVSAEVQAAKIGRNFAYLLLVALGLLTAVFLLLRKNILGIIPNVLAKLFK